MSHVEAFTSGVISRVYDTGAISTKEIPVDDIVSIIEAIANAIQQCRERRAEVLAANAQNPRPFQVFQLRRTCRPAARDLGVKPATLARSILDQAAAMDQADVQVAIVELVGDEGSDD